MLCSNDPVQLCSASADGTKMDLVNLYCFVSRVNIIRYETAPNLALVIRWLQCTWGWQIAWQRGKENYKYGGRNEIILARNCVTGLFSRLRVNTHSPERLLYRIQEWKVIRYRASHSNGLRHRFCSILWSVGQPLLWQSIVDMFIDISRGPTNFVLKGFKGVLNM